MMLRSYLERRDLPGGRACSEALGWCDGLPASATVADAVAACPRGGDWLLWAANRVGMPRRRFDQAVEVAAWASAHMRCADEVRKALPELAELIMTAMEVDAG